MSPPPAGSPAGGLGELVAAELAQPVPEGARRLAERARARHGAAVRAVLFYGSCLRRRSDAEGVLDLYVLVDRYRPAYRSRWLAWANALLPPNVFSLELAHEGRTLRAKVAVLSLAHLRRGVSRRAFEPYFWARFAQPCALVWCEGQAARHEVEAALAEAIRTFVGRAVALVPERFTAADLWREGLRATYACEVRTERGPAAADSLYAFAPERYAEATRRAVAELGERLLIREGAPPGTWRAALPAWRRLLGRAAWALRRPHGKALFLLRILRNAMTFEGGVEYLAWKIERHSGRRLDPRWRERRFPLAALGRELWRQYRRGAFR